MTTPRLRTRLITAALLALPLLELTLLLLTARTLGPLATLLLLLAAAATGLLVLLPGFGSDLIAIPLLAPPVRRTLAALVGDTLLRHLTRHRNTRIIRGTLVGEPRTDDPPSDQPRRKPR